MITTIMLMLQLMIASPDSTGFNSGKGKENTPIAINEYTITVGIRAESKYLVSQKTIEKLEIKTLNVGQEMPFQLSKTPSILFQSDNGLFTGYSTLRLRGIDQTRINMTLNGMPLNEPEDQGAYFSNYVDFMSSMNSVQIQRGIGTSTNGVASYGGSVNFEFNSLSDSTRGVELGYGSYNTHRVSGFANYELSNSVRGYIRVSNQATDGYRYHSDSKASSVFGSVGYVKENDIVQLIFFTGREHANMAYTAESIDDIRNDPRTNTRPKDEVDNFNQSIVQLQYAHKLTDASTLNFQVFYNRLSGNYGYFAGDMLNFYLTSNWVGFVSNYNVDFGDIKLYSGIYASTYKRNHFLNLNPLDADATYDNNFYYNSGIKNEFSAFTKLVASFDKLSLYGDVQFRTVHFKYIPESSYGLSISPITWNFVNPKFGINYEVNDDFSLYYSIGLMHREPTRIDMLNGDDDITPANVQEISGFNRVHPEHVIDNELGMNYALNDLKWHINVFNMQFSNEIAAIGKLSEASGLPLRKNVPSSNRRGIEIDVEYTVVKNLRFDANTTYMTSKIDEYATDGKAFYNVIPLLTPKWISNATMYIDVAPVQFIVVARHVGDSYLDNENTVICPSYFLVNGIIRLNINSSNISLHINNMFNKKYYSGGYAYNATPYYFVQAGKTVFISTEIAL